MTNNLNTAARARGGSSAAIAYNMLVNNPKNQFRTEAAKKGVTSAEADRIYDLMEKSANNDQHIGSSVRRQDILAETAQQMLKLGIIDKSPNLTTIHALGNLTVAYDQLHLPKLENSAVWALTNSTQKSPDIFDPSPFLLKAINMDISSSITIMPVPAMVAWTTADQLKSIKDGGFDIINHPEMFMGINSKVISNLWCGFQNPYGLSYMEKQNGNVITPASQDFRDLTKLQWDLYSQFTPQRGNSSTVYDRSFLWGDSTQLKADYTDMNQLKAALFWKFFIPSSTYGLNEHIILNGIYGARVDLKQTYDLYKTSMSVPINGTIVGKEAPAKDEYYSWLGDRGGWSLSNTVGQYLGLDPKTVPQSPNGISLMEWVKMINNNNGMDQYLTKNDPDWTLVRHLVGSSWARAYLWPTIYGESGGGDVGTTNYITPSLLRMAGFPVYFVNIEPTPFGASNREWAVGLPPKIADSLNRAYPDSKIIFGPGYTFGLYNCIDGLQKDGQKAYFLLGDSRFDLLKNK